MTHSTLRKNSRRPKKTMTSRTTRAIRKGTIHFILGYSKALRVVNAPPVGEMAIVDPELIVPHCNEKPSDPGGFS
jgi:hypothetical protein